MTLDQIGQILNTYAVKADVRHAEDLSLEEFRTLAVQALSTPNQYVIVNYLRRSLGQERGGHISPLAAYDTDTDRFLVLDVSRYKYPPIWVQAADLFAAMNTTDSDNQNRTRGFVLVASSHRQSRSDPVRRGGRSPHFRRTMRVRGDPCRQHRDR
jgi:hypothetical protein